MQDVRPPRKPRASGKRSTKSASSDSAQAALRSSEAWQYAPKAPKLKMPHPDLLVGTPPTRRHRTGRILGSTAGTVLVVAIGWSAASVYAARTTIGGQQLASRASDDTFRQAFASQAAGYRLTVDYPDGTSHKYGLADLGMKVDDGASLQSARRAQQNWQQRLLWWRPVEAQAVITSNSQKLDDFIANKTTIIAQPSKDAQLSIKDGQIEVADAVTGKQYGLNDSRQTLLDNAQALRSTAIKLKELAVNPAVTAQALAPYKTTLEQAINQDISFTVKGTTISAQPSDIANWLEITPHKNSSQLDITVNSGKVAAFMETVTKAYVQPPKAQIMTAASTPDQPAKVLVGGVNGSDVTNKAAIAADVAAKLLRGTGKSYALDIKYEPYETITAQAYDKWIEVDLTHKRMYAYQKDQLQRTELVTAGAPATPTVTGQYKIYSKYAQQDMRGSNADGSGYFQPNVRWISYFYKDYAIHGNYWRPLSYFGNINSSHGCVSLVNGEAKWMYDWAPVGTPVIVHK